MIEHWQKFHYTVAALSFKKLFLVGITGGGVLGVTVGEAITNQWGAAGLSGVIGGTLMAVVLVIPRLMEQRRKGRESEAMISSKLFEQQSAFYERQLANKNRTLRFYQIVAAQRDLIATYERNSKHDVLGQLGLAEMIIHDYEHGAAACGRELLEYRPRGYRSICGDNDEKVEAAKQRIATEIPAADDL